MSNWNDPLPSGGPKTFESCFVIKGIPRIPTGPSGEYVMERELSKIPKTWFGMYCTPRGWRTLIKRRLWQLFREWKQKYFWQGK